MRSLFAALSGYVRVLFGFGLAVLARVTVSGQVGLRQRYDETGKTDVPEDVPCLHLLRFSLGQSLRAMSCSGAEGAASLRRSTNGAHTTEGSRAAVFAKEEVRHLPAGRACDVLEVWHRNS